ncbi:MAG TPA: hypothetical protein PK760_01710, partial [Flavobacteriales bacterium]|nr:hypothetical protein [Flavobacteriales bacterium]
MKRSSLFIGALLFTLATSFGQIYPTSVDICMAQEPGMLRVSIRANDFDFGQVLSGLVFTIRWNESSTSSLGAGTNPWCANCS